VKRSGRLKFIQFLAVVSIRIGEVRPREHRDVILIIPESRALGNGLGGSGA